MGCKGIGLEHFPNFLHNLLCACPNLHKTQIGILFWSLRNRFGKEPFLDSWIMPWKGIWYNQLWHIKNSCCNGDRVWGQATQQKIGCYMKVYGFFSYDTCIRNVLYTTMYTFVFEKMTFLQLSYTVHIPKPVFTTLYTACSYFFWQIQNTYQ